jgi:hypothetical protein
MKDKDYMGFAVMGTLLLLPLTLLSFAYLMLVSKKMSKKDNKIQQAETEKTQEFDNFTEIEKQNQEQIFDEMESTENDEIKTFLHPNTKTNHDY